jgi:hypothetical protein
MKVNALAVATALTLAAAAPLFAQSQTSPPPAASPTGQPMWYSHQPDETRASKLIGTKVVNAANETIGDINEIVLGKDGKVAAMIIGVGGFLGMGEREVAVNFESLRMSRDSSGNLVLAVNATKDQLKGAPEWRWDTRKN